MLNDGIQGSENVFCMLACAMSNVTSSTLNSMAAANTATTAVTASVKNFMTSVFSRGKNASASAPSVGKKTIALRNLTCVSESIFVRTFREVPNSADPAPAPPLAVGHRVLQVKAGEHEQSDCADDDEHHVLPKLAGLHFL